jgi:HK97 gp10 family phage protein
MADSLQQVIADFATLKATLRGQVLRHAGSSAANIITTDAKARAPKRTSNLTRSIQQKAVRVTGSEAIFEIGPSVKYGRYVEEGTGVFGPKKQPIIIKPGAKGFLAWMTVQGNRIGQRGTSAGKVFKTKAGTQYAFTRKPVEIQGSRPQPYMAPAFEAKEREASLGAMDVIFHEIQRIMAR